LRQSAESRIADRFGPPHVIVNEEGDIIHYSARTAKYLEAPYGPPTRQLLTTARKELRLDLRNALRTAIETRRIVTRPEVAFETEDHGIERVSLTVEPLPDGPDGRLTLLITFEQRGAPEAAPSTPASVEDQPEFIPNSGSSADIELRDTRERLQGTIEEYETALEELKSANEELVSLNEEMQSSNEELESTKEELQSLNEELQTVNQELTAKIEDLDRANVDLSNLFESTNVAAIFLDRHLVIRSFTPAVSELFNILATDKGRPLGDLAIKLEYAELQADIIAVLETGNPIERRAHKNEANAPYFLARLTPYRNADQEIDGVVATFVDVTSLAKSEERQRTLVAELNHRVKNMLTVIMAIAKQSLTPLASAEAFLMRLQALARSHEVLWQENHGDIGFEEFVRQALAPYVMRGSERLSVTGPLTTLPPQVATSFGMILDELSTNAVRYGALSNETGRVAIDWSTACGEGEAPSILTLTWRETGGPTVTAPSKLGFGLTLVQREVDSHSGTTQFDFSEDGFSARIEVSFKTVKANSP
jgi:two-component system CheB/CheR fusion protein